MASPKLSAQERKDLDKYTKALALKSIQIIVQSRLGDKVQTHCKSQTSGAAWFGLAINDLPDVAAEAKKVLQGESASSWLPLCVEISLKTADGDQLILENWNLGILPEVCDPAVKMPCTIYSRMTLMLKSLISVTRVTPAYKLSRRQMDDSFMIYYRIYSGEPQLHHLGEGYKQFRVGQLCSPVGTIYLSVACRTKMTITPIQTQGTSIMVKSDHFHSDLSPKNVRYSKQSLKEEVNWNEPVNGGTNVNVPLKEYTVSDFILPEEPHFKWSLEDKTTEKKRVNLDEPMRAGAFVDISKIKQYESDFILPEDPPFSWLLEDPRKKTENFNYSKSDLNDDQCSLNDVFPPDDKDVEIQDNLSGSPISRKSIWTIGPDDDKLMKELELPFATAGPVGELARFYRECYNAPPLQSFAELNFDDNPPPKEENETIDITEQLEIFETSLQEYEKMVSSLCQSPNNN